TGELVQLLPRATAGIDGPGGVQRPIGGDMQIGVDRAVGLVDSVEVRSGRLEARDLTAAQGLCQFAGAEPCQIVHGHCSSPRIGATLNRSPSRSGAPESACSTLSDGRTSSGRNTLV